MSVTLVEVMGAARCRAAALAAEVAGYLVLLAADQIAAAPRRVSARDVVVTEDGLVRLVGGSAAGATAAEAALRALLEELLLVASPGSGALLRAARRHASGGAERLVSELEVALIPANRSAARRALARLARETSRAREQGMFLESVQALEPPNASIEPSAVLPRSPESLPPVAPVPAAVHSLTPVVVATEPAAATPVPVTAPLFIAKTPLLEGTERLVCANEAPAAPEPEHESPAFEVTVVFPDEATGAPALVETRPTAAEGAEELAAAAEAHVVEVEVPLADPEPHTRPEPVILRRAAGESPVSWSWPIPVEPAGDAEVELTDPMPSMMPPTPSPEVVVASAIPSPVADSVPPVSPRFQRSEVSELVERFRVTDERAAADLCQDLKALAGVEGTLAPPSVTPPPIEAPTEDAADAAGPQQSGSSPARSRIVLGAVTAAVLLFAGVGSAVRAPARQAGADGQPACRARIVVDQAPAGAQIVVRPAAADSELDRRVGRGPVARFDALPCGEALEVVVEDGELGERRWRRIPVAAAELMPSADARTVSLRIAARAPLAAR
jgi:hypothetical protein